MNLFFFFFLPIMLVKKKKIKRKKQRVTLKVRRKIYIRVYLLSYVYICSAQKSELQASVGRDLGRIILLSHVAASRVTVIFHYM